jgi:hypothetical protein
MTLAGSEILKSKTGNSATSVKLKIGNNDNWVLQSIDNKK